MKPRTWFDLSANTRPAQLISQQDYDTWRKHRVFDHCRGLTQGQSFCEYFDVWDNLLLYNVISDASIESYIRDTYLET
jgi:hypothetical protein